MVTSSEFAKKLQNLIEIKGKSREEISRDLNVKYSTLSKWLNPNSREKMPRIENLVLLSEYFGVNLGDLLGASEKEALSSARMIPQYDSVKCGYPVNYVDDTPSDYVECPATINADFAVKAEGDSMNGLGIMDGDTVFIKEQHCFEDGEVMAICIGDSVVLKRCYHFEGGLRMKSENTENKYADQIYSAKQLEDKTAHIIGKLVACQRIF